MMKLAVHVKGPAPWQALYLHIVFLLFLKETADERHLNSVFFGNAAAEYHQTDVNRRACNASAE